MPEFVSKWGTVDGRDVNLFTIRNASGLEAQFLDLGATLHRLYVPDRSGARTDVVLGFGSAAAYKAGATYFGATVGRYGNRIRDGRFKLDGRDYALACNEGRNHLHGGAEGYDKRFWLPLDASESHVRFGLVSPDGDEGYPGLLAAQAEFRLGDDNVFSIAMTAEVSKPCPVNLVHHSYWNLAGHASGTVLDQELEIAADFYTPCDEFLMLSGEIATVSGTPFDFTNAKPIGRDFKSVPNGGAGRVQSTSAGFDHNWVLTGASGALRPVVRARDPRSGRAFELATTEPGVQFYHGGYLAGTAGKDGVTYPAHAGFTLETQKFPDAPNIPHFPSSRLDPHQIYDHRMAFRFSW